MSEPAPIYRRIARAELPTDTVALAQRLLGLVVVRNSTEGRCSGRIVEVEAYVVGDEASHAFRGRTPRNASMYGAPFHTYVYRIYGTAFCLNITTEAETVGAAVLLRALEPLEGISLMAVRRRISAVEQLCRGPGRLCQALSINLADDGVNILTDSGLWLAETGGSVARIGKSKRIGITKAAGRNLRFYEAGSRYLSGPRALSP